MRLTVGIISNLFAPGHAAETRATLLHMPRTKRLTLALRRTGGQGCPSSVVQVRQRPGAWGHMGAVPDDVRGWGGQTGCVQPERS